MGHEPIKGFFWCSRALAGLPTMKLLGGCQQRPAPAVFVAMLVSWIDEILRHDATGHLQTSDVAVELAAHLGPRKATGSTQFTRDQRPLFLQSEEDSFLDGTLRRRRMPMATVVAEIRPPRLTDKARLASEELAIDAVSLRNDRTFPLPKWPVPATIRQHHVATVVSHHLLCRIAVNPTIQQRQEADFLNQLHHLGTTVDLAMLHRLEVYYVCKYKKYFAKFQTIQQKKTYDRKRKIFGHMAILRQARISKNIFNYIIIYT